MAHPVQGNLWVGFSGGLDSTVLLHLLATCRVPVRALHIHHGLSESADRWVDHCRAFAQELEVPFTLKRVVVDKRDGGLEQGARLARYLAFDQVLSSGDQILLGHHGDDQAETFLLRLLRGAGVLGLAGMAEWRSIGGGKSLLRPLLKVGRADLEIWARDHGLSWIDDESNTDESLDRNFLRRRILPLLSVQWSVRQRISRAVDNLRESAELLRELALTDLESCGLRAERFGESLDLSLFSALSMTRRKNLLRHWILQQGGLAPESTVLQEAISQVDSAALDAQLEVQLGRRVVRRFKGRLYLTSRLKTVPADGEKGVSWDGVSRLSLSAGGVLEPAVGWSSAEYQVSYRRGGERAHPADRDRSQTLKKLLQERGLEPWLRDRVPLVFLKGELVAVAGLFSCKANRATPDPPPGWRFFD
ncbi:tRNA lysidine(34) synthetase TilS [Microbulbifer sp. OS29]|uniref:tRNA(Ile)-lysidine synthase n=1 Tax=Microbulbifer okhotskensis TaxID=2926617 RepID=A0A9X2ERV9_9GAMM|nr:tRNA lysidine(34) synthetase TilS [Microbulbifer okhotskensis]MCO1334596.1 tRNA lysidine(34) synthetase TilS [Microbulbifer okhotskensis]